MMEARKVRFQTLDWKKIEEQAAHHCMSTAAYIRMRVLRNTDHVPRAAEEIEVVAPEPEPHIYGPSEPVVNREPSPLLGNLPEIRKWQKELEDAEFMYNMYKEGVLEEDWEAEQETDYVRACSERIVKANTMLQGLIPARPQEVEHADS